MDGKPRPERHALSAWLASEQRGWDEIERLVGQISPAQALVPGYLPGWSVKDMIAHLAGWFAEAGMELERAEPGSCEPEKAVDEKNDIFVEANRDQPLSVVLGEARTARNRMLQDLRSLGRMPEHAVEALRKAGPEHYIEHLARLQQWVAELSSNPSFESTGPTRRHDFFPNGTAPDPAYAGKLR